MKKRRTSLILKDEKKGNETSHFRLITCFPFIRKVFTRILIGQVYGHMERDKFYSDEQKGCRRESRGTKDQLMIDKIVIKNCKRRMTSLRLAWIDYTKA